MKCKCGGQIMFVRGITSDGDYIECSRCGERIYVNETGTTW
jgi:DNA-directed RNA polymerase subunit RPC12/RpoP